MNLNQLRFALAVAEHRSFSQAAEACFVTQPTLSNAVAQLEEELGGRLFHRTTRSVAATPFGHHLLPLIAAVLEAQQELVGAADAYHNPQHKLVRIGLSPLIDVQLLDRLLAPYRERHPGVELFFKQCFLDDMETRLANGSVDIAIVPRRLPRIGRESCRLYAEPLRYLPREADGRPAAETPELTRDPLILTSGCGLADAIGELYRSLGLPLTPYPGQALSYRVVEEWAGLGIGAGILPRSKLSPDNATARPIPLPEGGEAEVIYEAQWMPESGRIPHLAALIAHLREAVPALLEGVAA